MKTDETPRCRFCRGTEGVLVEDPALGAIRIRRDGTRKLRQTWHHGSCLFIATGLTEVPYPMNGVALERARQRRKAAASAVPVSAKEVDS